MNLWACPLTRWGDLVLLQRRAYLAPLWSRGYSSLVAVLHMVLESSSLTCSPCYPVLSLPSPSFLSLYEILLGAFSFHQTILWGFQKLSPLSRVCTSFCVDFSSAKVFLASVARLLISSSSVHVALILYLLSTSFRVLRPSRIRDICATYSPPGW